MTAESLNSWEETLAGSLSTKWKTFGHANSIEIEWGRRIARDDGMDWA